MGTVIVLVVTVPLLACLFALIVFVAYRVAREDRECRHCGTVCVRAPELDHPEGIKVYRCPNCGKVYDECDLIRGRGISG